jgi:hypothetical protein
MGPADIPEACMALAVHHLAASILDLAARQAEDRHRRPGHIHRQRLPRMLHRRHGMMNTIDPLTWPPGQGSAS